MRNFCLSGSLVERNSKEGTFLACFLIIGMKECSAFSLDFEGEYPTRMVLIISNNTALHVHVIRVRGGDDCNLQMLNGRPATLTRFR